MRSRRLLSLLVLCVLLAAAGCGGGDSKSEGPKALESVGDGEGQPAGEQQRRERHDERGDQVRLDDRGELGRCRRVDAREPERSGGVDEHVGGATELVHDSRRHPR